MPNEIKKYSGSTGDLAHLSRVLNSPTYDIEEKISKVKRSAMLTILQTVISATPYDTGRAKNNWLVSIGEPSNDEIIGDEGDFDKSGQGAINKGQAVIAAVGKFSPAGFITNNLPYIEKLNKGSSAQAPADFVRISITKAIAAIREVRLW